MPTFITHEVEALFKEQYSKKGKGAREIAAFLDDNHIKEVCERVRKVVVDEYIHTGDKFVWVKIDDPLSTQAVARSKECRDTLLTVLKSLEDSTKEVFLRGGHKATLWRPSMEGYILVRFSWE